MRCRLQDPKSYTGIHKRNNVNALCALNEAPSSSVKPPPTGAKVCRCPPHVLHACVSSSLCLQLWWSGCWGVGTWASFRGHLIPVNVYTCKQTPRGRLFAETPGR